MDETPLQESTRQLLDESPVDGKDVDAKIRQLLRAEYLRRLGQYRRVIQSLAQKYGMIFDMFANEHVIQQNGFSWEVESDAMDWETAISGIKTLEARLEELREEGRV